MRKKGGRDEDVVKASRRRVEGRESLTLRIDLAEVRIGWHNIRKLLRGIKTRVGRTDG